MSLNSHWKETAELSAFLLIHIFTGRPCERLDSGQVEGLLSTQSLCDKHIKVPSKKEACRKAEAAEFYDSRKNKSGTTSGRDWRQRENLLSVIRGQEAREERQKSLSLMVKINSFPNSDSGEKFKTIWQNVWLANKTYQNQVHWTWIIIVSELKFLERKVGISHHYISQCKI